MVAFILPGFFILMLMLSYFTGGFKRIFLAISSILLAVMIYFFLGVSSSSCPRFKSIPFGGCTYTDEAITMNVIFWTLLVFFSFLFFPYIINKKKQ